VWYYQNGQLPIISIVNDSSIPNTTTGFYFVDNGKQELSVITSEEYNNISGVSIKPKIIESKNNYLFASGIEYCSIYDDVEIRTNFLNWDARSFRYDANGECKVYDYSTNTESQIGPQQGPPLDHDCYNPYNNINQQYVNDVDCIYVYGLNGKAGGFGGYGPNVSWKFIIKEVKVDKCGLNDSELNKRYTPNGNVELFKSLQRDELYRYGIILYDEYGNASPVKWIADIRTPHANINNPYTVKTEEENGQNHSYLCANVLGIEFSVKNLPQECKAYEIVRCNRTENDIATISQGVLSKPWRNKEEDDTIYNPTGFLTLNKVASTSTV